MDELTKHGSLAQRATLTHQFKTWVRVGCRLTYKSSSISQALGLKPQSEYREEVGVDG